MWRWWLIWLPSRVYDGLLVVYQIALIIIVTVLVTSLALDLLAYFAGLPLP